MEACAWQHGQTPPTRRTEGLPLRRRALFVGIVAVLLLGVLALRAWRARSSAAAPRAAPARGGGLRDGAAGPRGDEPLPPAQGALAISGVVRGPDGPVAGAVVTATAPRGDEPLTAQRCHCGNDCGQRLLECGCGEAAAQLAALVAERRGDAVPVARATTGRDGRFRLEGLAEGTYAVWAEAPAGAAVVPGVSAGAEGVVLEADGGASVAGKVVGDDGKGLAGAAVSAISGKHGRIFDGLAGADGRFALGPLPAGAYTVVAVAAGLLPERGRVEPGARVELRLELHAPRALAGRVAEGGAPAADVLVALEGEHRRAEVRTDADGAFVFRGLRPGEYLVRATRGDRAAERPVPVRAGRDVRDVVLALGDGVRVDGQVVDEAGASLAGAKVRADALAPRRRARVATARTDAAGRFQLGPLEPAELEVSASLDGYLADAPVRVAAVESRSATIVLRRAARIEGRVEDPDGNPVAGAELSAERPPGEDGPGAFERSGEDGTFALSVRDGTWQVAVDHDVFPRLQRTLTAPSRGVVLRLERGAAIEGEVVDDQGSPVADAEVELSSALRQRASEFQTRHAQSDRRGRFRLEGLLAGRGRLVAVPAVTPGSTPQWVARADVDVPRSGTVKVRLQADRGLAVAGTVVDPDGAPVADAGVLVRPSAGASGGDDEPGASGGHAVTDSAGRFVIHGLRPGEHQVAVRKEGWDGPRQPVRVQAGDAGVRIVVARAGFVRARLVGDGGAPVPNARAELAGGFGLDHGAASGEDGRVAVVVPRDGTVTLRLTADGYAPLERAVEVTRGADVDLGDVVLRRGREIAGRVVDAETGAGVMIAHVTWLAGETRAGSDHGTALTTSRDGSFVVRDAGEGGQLLVEHEQYAPATVPAPADGPVVVRLGRGGSVAVRVLSASGAPLARADVGVAGGWRSRSGRTDGDGRFVASALAPGRYTVHAAVGEGPTNPGLAGRAVEVREGERVEVELRERRSGATLAITLRGPGVDDGQDVHVALVRGELAPGALRLSTLGAPIEPVEAEPRRTATFELLEPGRYTFLLARPDGEDVRVLVRPVEVGDAPRQSVAVEVPAELPIAVW